MTIIERKRYCIEGRDMVCEWLCVAVAVVVVVVAMVFVPTRGLSVYRSHPSVHPHKHTTHSHGCDWSITLFLSIKDDGCCCCCCCCCQAGLGGWMPLLLRAVLSPRGCCPNAKFHRPSVPRTTYLLLRSFRWVMYCCCPCSSVTRSLSRSEH